jgi:glucose/arabinose dehydrogenase
VRHLLFSVLLLGSCWSGQASKPNPGPLVDVQPLPPSLYDANVDTYCKIPGSVRFDGVVKEVVQGAKGLPDLSWMNIPAGFCVHYYATVPNARSLRIAPAGEVFVTSPTGGTTGGGAGGKAAIIVLPDDNRDGLADSAEPFATGLVKVTGILFANGYFYFQDDTKIVRVPYTPGQRTVMTPPETIADLTTRWQSTVHWPKPIDIADDGTIYVGNGADQGEPCVEPHTFQGGVYAIGGNRPMDGEPIINGFRNPIYLRCQRGHNNCFTVELTRDYSAGMKGREKIVPIRKGDDWGYPCCATKNTPFPDTPAADCSMVPPENVAFYVADTPFGFDFEPGAWPAPWKNRLFATLHGAFGTWVGARMIAIEVDPGTGLPKPGGTLLPNGGQGTAGDALDFATGWDDGKLDHGRPADVTFSQDGRMFVAQDNGPTANQGLGIVYWIAPLDLPKP